jgi:hypothetical protein
MWAIRLHAALLRKPINECDSYFTISSIMELENVEYQACMECIRNTRSRYSLFNVWGQNVRRIITKELEALEELYSL